MTYNLEYPDLAGIRDMRTNACTCIIIPYSDDSQSLRYILRKFAQIYNLLSLFPSDKLYSDIQILPYHLIDLSLNRSNLLSSWL